MKMVAILLCLAPMAARAANIEGTVAGARENGGLTFVSAVPRSTAWMENGVTRDGRFLAPRSARNASAETDTDGHFQIKGIAPGAYYLVAERVIGMPPMSRTRIPQGTLHSDGIAVRPLDVQDADIKELAITLSPRREVHFTVGAEPGSSCSLMAQTDTVTPILLRPQVPLVSGMGEIRAAEDFMVTNVAPVPTQVSVYPRLRCYVKSIKLADQDAPDGLVDFAREGTLAVTLARGGGITGSVVDAANANMPVLAGLSFVPDQGPATTRQIYTTSRGTFTLGDVAPGTYRILAWTGYAPNAETIRTTGKLLTVEKDVLAEVKLEVVHLPEDAAVK